MMRRSLGLLLAAVALIDLALGLWVLVVKFLEPDYFPLAARCLVNAGAAGAAARRGLRQSRA